MDASPEQTFFGVNPVKRRKKRESVCIADLFTDTEKEMKISMCKVTDPSFETGDENAQCCQCGLPAEYVTYCEEQTRYEAARIVKNGLWEIVRSRANTNHDMSDKTYFCETCFPFWQ